MRRRNRGWRDDPLVVISKERLRAAVIERGESVASLARRLRMRQPTLHYLVAGKTARCRASTRRGLARHFGIKEGWLAGDPDAGPFRDRHLAFAESNGTIVDADERRTGLPPLAQLRVARLLEDCLNRWDEDVESGIAPLPEAGTLLGDVCRNCVGEARILWLGDYLEGFLLRPTFLRLLVFGMPKRLAATEIDVLRWYWSEDEDFTSAWVEVLQAQLSPWLENKRSIDYERCYSLLEAGANRDRQLFNRAKADGALEALWPT